MQAVIVDRKLMEDLLKKRKAIGADRWDEVWDGVMHMNPAPSLEHQRIEKLLTHILDEVVEQAGMGLVLHQVNVADPHEGAERFSYS